MEMPNHIVSITYTGFNRLNLINEKQLHIHITKKPTNADSLRPAIPIIVTYPPRRAAIPQKNTKLMTKIVKNFFLCINNDRFHCMAASRTTHNMESQYNHQMYNP